MFNRLKKEAERICLKVGTRFLGGFAVPEGSIDSIRSELERIALSFRAARDDFLSRYDEAVEGWVTKHPEFATAIRKAVDPVEVVAAGLRFDYVIFRVSHPEKTETGDTADSSLPLDRKVGSLSENLFREIAQDANDLVEHSLLGRPSVTRKALSPLKRMRDKLDGLAFLDHRVQPVVATLDELLSRAPKTGALDGRYLNEMIATALLLSDPEKIKRHGQGLLQVENLMPLQIGEGSALSALEEAVGPLNDGVAVDRSENDWLDEPDVFGELPLGDPENANPSEDEAVLTDDLGAWF